ncbi:hypothetical protein JHK85_045327 [Glycine max]|nr:hypothetical protein JHK85_045327 [Glycine max]
MARSTANGTGEYEDIWRRYLEELKGRFNNPWTLVGDFNDILIPSEQGEENARIVHDFGGVCVLLNLDMALKRALDQLMIGTLPNATRFKGPKVKYHLTLR